MRPAVHFLAMVACRGGPKTGLRDTARQDWRFGYPDFPTLADPRQKATLPAVQIPQGQHPMIIAASGRAGRSFLVHCTPRVAVCGEDATPEL